MKDILQILQAQIKSEGSNICSWWMQHAVDETMGGFYGRINQYNQVVEGSPKGVVLNARILWTFAAAFRHTGNNHYRQIAQRAYDYIATHFIDKEFGGVYWTVNGLGQPHDTKKQLYALAFTLYAVTEWYLAERNEQVRQLSFDLYNTIEKFGRDKRTGGYAEAFSKDWKNLPDQRLSSKDANEKRSMNTHLHLLEAFTNLYRVLPDFGLRANIAELINLFLHHIIDPLTGHLVLFFDEDWNPRSSMISFGHDIEAAWLLHEAAEVIGDDTLLAKLNHASVKLAKVAARGLDTDGGLWYEKDNHTGHLVKQKHWWPQAEAMVGFFHAFQLTGDQQFLQYTTHCWQFIQQSIIDTKLGEWFWGVDEHNQLMPNEDKAGLWKCPYHNARACFELVKRIGQVLRQLPSEPEQATARPQLQN